jgi:hypothetical protein
MSIHCCIWLRRYPNTRHAQQQKHATTSIRNKKIANKNNNRYRLRKKPLVISAFGKKSTTAIHSTRAQNMKTEI